MIHEIFERTHGSSIPGNYIHFTKTTNERLVGGILNTFWGLGNA